MVERPLLEHLGSLGWETLIWSKRQITDNVSRFLIVMCFLSRGSVRRY